MDMNERGFEHDPSREIEETIHELSELARRLGFSESEEMKSISSKLTRENFGTEIGKWQELAAEIVKRANNPEVDIALMVSESTIRFRSVDITDFLSSIDYAIETAEQFGLSDLADKLKELTQPFDKIERPYPDR